MVSSRGKLPKGSPPVRWTEAWWPARSQMPFQASRASSTDISVSGEAASGAEPT